MGDVILCSAAEVDYTESLIWYAERSVEVANASDAEVIHTLGCVAVDPERYPKCDERHRFILMRRYPFQIIYRLVQKNVVIVAIAHVSRSPDFWEGR